MRKYMKNKLISALVTLAVITLLILAGPAQGFTLNLIVDNASPTQGQIITFTAEIDIPTGEQIPVQELTFSISGTSNKECKFYVIGDAISGCDGMTIKRINAPKYGYGKS